MTSRPKAQKMSVCVLKQKVKSKRITKCCFTPPQKVANLLMVLWKENLAGRTYTPSPVFAKKD